MVAQLELSLIHPITVGALHAASLDRHLRAVENRGDGRNFADGSDRSGTVGEFPTSSDAPSPLVEYASCDQLLDGENRHDDAAKNRNSFNDEAKSGDALSV